MEFLITSEGDWLVAGSKEVEATVGYDDPDFDLTAFAVKNLGFIQVSWASPTKVRLRFHPDQVAPGALVGLKSRQETFGDAGVELGWLSARWHEETFERAPEAIARVDALSAAAAPRTRYQATRRDLRQLGDANA